MKSAIAALMLITLAACGGSSGGSDDKGDSGGSGTPACSKVWVAGKTLPKDYDGCMNGDTTEVAVSVPCGDEFPIFTYEPKGNGFYTDAKGKIVEAGEDYADDPAYSKRFDACS